MELSSIKESYIDIDSLSKDNDFYISIDRLLFNDICKDLFKRYIEILKKTINESGL